MGIRDCSYGRTTGMGTGMLQLQVWVYALGIDVNLFNEVYHNVMYI